MWKATWEQVPHSCLIKFYLAFALIADRNDEDRMMPRSTWDRHSRFPTPKVRWSHGPRFIPIPSASSVDFADDRINAPTSSRKYDVDNPKDDELRDKRLRRPEL